MLPRSTPTSRRIEIETPSTLIRFKHVKNHAFPQNSSNVSRPHHCFRSIFAIHTKTLENVDTQIRIIYLMKCTQGVVTQSPEPEAHNKSERACVWTIQRLQRPPFDTIGLRFQRIKLIRDFTWVWTESRPEENISHEHNGLVQAQMF